MSKNYIERIRERTFQATRDKVAKKIEEPFSPLGVILPEELIYWDESKWEEEDYIKYAADEAWNIDEFKESGYIAMKRMLAALIDPNKKCKTLHDFTAKLKNLYEFRKNN